MEIHCATRTTSTGDMSLEPGRCRSWCLLTVLFLGCSTKCGAAQPLRTTDLLLPAHIPQVSQGALSACPSPVLPERGGCRCLLPQHAFCWLLPWCLQGSAGFSHGGL